MLKGRAHDHVGMATNDLEKTVKWYVDVLGFEEFGSCAAPDGTPIIFIRNNDIKYEIFQPIGGIDPALDGKLDHMSFLSDDIEKDYKYCMDMGYECTTGGIQGIETAWKNGCRYFKIKAPGMGEVEFDQIV